MAAAAYCGNRHGFSRTIGACEPASGILHFLVAGALNSKKIPHGRGAFRTRDFCGTTYNSTRVRISELGLSFKVQPESCTGFCSGRRWSHRLHNADIRGRRFLAPLAAVATATGDWGSRWEHSHERREVFWKIWNSKSTSTGERLAVLGILALTGLVVARVLRGSSFLSVGGIILFLFLGGFHHRFKSAFIFVSEKLQHLKGSFLRSAGRMPISFKQRSLADNSLPFAAPSRAASGTSKLGESIDAKDVANFVSLLTRIIQTRDSEVSAEDLLFANNLINLQYGITELRKDLYRAATTFRGEGVLQSQLQNRATFGSQPHEEYCSHATVVQVPAQEVVSNFYISSDNSSHRVTPSSSNLNGLGEADMKFSAEGGTVDSSDSPGSSDSPQGSQRSPISVPVRKEIPHPPTYQVITADYTLEPVTRFTPVAPQKQAAAASLLTEVGVSKVGGNREKLRVAKGSLQHFTYTPEQNICEPLSAAPEFMPDIAEQSSCRRVDSIEMETGFKQKGHEIRIEDDFALLTEAQPFLSLNEIAAEEPTLAFERNREDEHFMNMMVIGQASADPWHDDSRVSGSDIYENEDFHRETSVVQDIITPSPSGRWADYDSDSAPYVKSVRKGVYNYGGGKGRSNAKPSVDFWGSVASAGMAERGTLTRIKATGRGSLGSVDDVDNEKPGKRRGSRKDEQLSREQVRRRDSAEVAGQRTTSGKQYVQDERDLWDNESLTDNAVSSERSVRPLTDDQESERDLDFRNAPDGDRDWSYGARGSQNRKIIEEEGEYRNGRSRDGRYYSQERTRQNNVQDDRQMLSEEDEEVFPKREEYFVNESSSWVRDGGDLSASQNGGDLGGNYSSQMRMSSRVPFSSRNKRQTVEEDDQEGDLYRRDARTLEEEEQVHGIGRRSWAESQNPGREELSGSDYDSEPEISTDMPPYVQNELEPEERNLPVRQPSRLQLEKFDRLLDEGEALLEEGMQGLEGRIEVGVAERMLYEAASLFDAAAQIDPSSLVAVGFWGNTLLVHGELKLKLSQQLRSMLPSSNAYTMTRAMAGAGWGDERESLELTLQSVCEECEELLVDAGRKYRMALSLDRTDMRALYNWGLALCYRGQLIADEGGERAIEDADKVYLAAIDKFEAMLGMSQEYAPGALYNWGLAMRDRARLRPMGNRDRVRLLLQAKELFQDAVRLDPNNGQARGGVTAVLAELQELKRFEDMQNEQEINGRSSRSWWQ